MNTAWILNLNLSLYKGPRGRPIWNLRNTRAGHKREKERHEEREGVRRENPRCRPRVLPLQAIQDFILLGVHQFFCKGCGVREDSRKWRSNSKKSSCEEDPRRDQEQFLIQEFKKPRIKKSSWFKISRKVCLSSSSHPLLGSFPKLEERFFYIGFLLDSWFKKSRKRFLIFLNLILILDFLDVQ